MATIEVDDETYERLEFVARLVDEPIGVIVRRLVDRYAAPSTDRASSRHPEETPNAAQALNNAKVAPPRVVPSSSRADVRTDVDAVRDQWMAIHKIFKGYRVEGRFNPVTHEVQLRTEPWTNRYFSSPTSAAVAVVEKYSPGIESSNTNGRRFWFVTQTGKDLRSVIGER